MVEARAGRSQDPEVTERIRRAALELIAERGYAALRIEHVADAAGCGKAAVYRRYLTRAELVVDAFLSHLDLGSERDLASVREELLTLVEEDARNQTQDVAQRDGRRLGLAALDSEIYPHLWIDFFLLRQERGLRSIRRGIERGELPQDVDAHLILDVIGGLTLRQQTLHGEPFDRDRAGAVIDALLAHPPRLVSPGEEAAL